MNLLKIANLQLDLNLKNNLYIAKEVQKYISAKFRKIKGYIFYSSFMFSKKKSVKCRIVISAYLTVKKMKKYK